MRNGPEYGKGWRARYETEAGTVTVEARHYERQRLPRPHEAARQMGRGRPLAMVADPIHEWTLRCQGFQPATVRATPDGRFHTHALPRAHAGLKDLAEAWGAQMARRAGRVPEPEPDEPAAPGP